MCCPQGYQGFQGHQGPQGYQGWQGPTIGAQVSIEVVVDTDYDDTTGIFKETKKTLTFFGVAGGTADTTVFTAEDCDA